MKIKSVCVRSFRRFENLTISDLPPAKLIVMAGPNGSGKSSLFDAFSAWQQANHSGLGNWDKKYYNRGNQSTGWQNQVVIDFYTPAAGKKTFYLRSAYRNDPEFELNNLQKMNDPSEQIRLRRMIEQDSAVSQNYQRLAADAFEAAFDPKDPNKTLGQFTQDVIGDIRSAVLRVFPDLDLNTLGNPLIEGTFRFTKGTMSGFSYKNLSGGEKAAFDLILDLLIKKKTYTDTVFTIDEPETHMNTRIQANLLTELYNLIPPQSQLWIATHSIGMMRRSRELYEQFPGEVVFLDFEGNNYDQPVAMRPVRPDRKFWERVLYVALDDLSHLVAPKEVVICEGNPSGPIPGKNDDHDARCYETIFNGQRPDTKFISGGNSKDTANDRLKFAAVLPKVVSGLSIRRLIDRDDHSPLDSIEFRRNGIAVLSRRHIESYLYDDEILAKLYSSEGQTARTAQVLDFKKAVMAEAASRGRAADDLKGSASKIYQYIKNDLQLVAGGNEELAFARNVLAPLITPDTTTYLQLEKDIFFDCP